MKLALNVIGVVLLLVGALWILQGIGIVQGSFMTGQAQWALIGILSVLIGGGLLVYNFRQKRV